MNPLSQKVTIPFRHGSVNCELTLPGLFKAEMELNKPIISPSATPLGERPLMAQKALYLYASLLSVPDLHPTMDEVLGMLAGPKSKFIQDALDTLLEGLTPHLLEYNKQFETKAAGKDPLAVEPGGPGNGLMPSQSSGSPAKSFGPSRRGK